MAADEQWKPRNAAPAPVAFDRQPPQDLPAEQSVLGGMLLSKDAIADVFEVLTSADFYKPAHVHVFDAILDLYSRGEPADPITVSAELERAGLLPRVGGSVYLHHLTAMVPTAANAGFYAQIVGEKAVLRRLVEAGTRIAQLGYGGAEGDAGSGEVDEIVDRAEQEMYKVAERRTTEDYIVLEELLGPTMDEIDAIQSRGGLSLGVPTGFTDLDTLTNGFHPGQMIIIAARPGVGKALALDTPLPTPRGWTTMGEVAVGDRLIGADGIPTTVVAATEVMDGRPCFEVEFSDGTTIVADAEHQWVTRTRADRRGVAGPGAIRTTEQLRDTLRCGTADSRVNHAIATTAPLELPDQELPIPPYALGVWLGDGAPAAASYTSADPEIAVHIGMEGLRTEYVGDMRYSLRLTSNEPVAERECLVCGSTFVPATSQVRTCGRSCGGRSRGLMSSTPKPPCPECGGPSAGGRMCMECRLAHGSVQAPLRTLGVLSDKHIPTSYLRGSVEQRRSLLAGLMDTHGTVAASGSVHYTSTSRRLADGVEELVVSLGHRCGRTEKVVRGGTESSSVAYTLTFTTSDEVFRLGRKQLVHKERRRGLSDARHRVRFVTDVRPVVSVPVRCVQVDNDDHLYLAGRSMVATHNSTLALDVARNASVKHGLTSVIFSLEMSKTEITMRLLSAEAGIKLSQMRSGKMQDQDWQKIVKRMSEISDAPLFIDDSPNMTMMEIRAKARRLKQKNDLKLIVLDYLQLMSSGKKVESRQQEVSEFSRQMKLLAKELEVPVIAISQLNRGPEQRTDKRPMLSDLRESGSLEQDADMVILVHRPDVFESDDPRAGEADLIVAKHRNGQTMTVAVAHQLHYSRFTDLALQ